MPRAASPPNSGLIGEECNAIWVIEPDARRPLPSASTRESLETTHIQVGLTACEANVAPERVKVRTPISLSLKDLQADISESRYFDESKCVAPAIGTSNANC